MTEQLELEKVLEEEVKKLKVELKEIEKQEVPTLALFGTTSPENAILKATEIAKVCKDIISKQKLFTVIKQKAYVHCEGWTTMGAILGLFAHIVDVEDLCTPDGMLRRYRAICEVKTLDGRTITRAESECSSDEGTRGKDNYGNDKKGKSEWDDYALRSMAETRATSKAFRLALGWIMKLAGYEPTPAEEVNEDNISEDASINHNGEYDKKLGELSQAIQKLPDERNIDFYARQVEWLAKQLNEIVKLPDKLMSKDTQKVIRTRDELYMKWEKK